MRNTCQYVYHIYHMGVNGSMYVLLYASLLLLIPVIELASKALVSRAEHICLFESKKLSKYLRYLHQIKNVFPYIR